MSKKTGEKTSKAAPAKKSVVGKIIQLTKDYPIIGVINMHGLPASSLQKMKSQLRGKVELVMTRRTLIERALKEAKLDQQIAGALTGMPALLFTKENPFSLFKTIKKSKTPAAAKAGQLAPRDIILPAGPTPFSPGPVISEFAALGIKAGVEGGKVAIKQDATVVKEGQPISDKLASMLQRLGVEPMEIGLDVLVVYEKGVLYPKSVLDIDETQFMNNVMTAASEAFNLAVDITFTTSDTIETLLQKASREAKAVAKEGAFLTAETVEELLAQGTAEAQAVAEAGNLETH